MKDHPKTIIAVVVRILAWAIDSSLATRKSERLLSTVIRIGLEILGGGDMLVGIG